MQQVHDKAHATWAQVQKTDNQLRTAMTPGYMTKTFWILIGVTLFIFAFSPGFCMRPNHAVEQTFSQRRFAPPSNAAHCGR